MSDSKAAIREGISIPSSANIRRDVAVIRKKDKRYFFICFELNGKNNDFGATLIMNRTAEQSSKITIFALWNF
jgi:hypothetical protein